jgi:hypothetical protein
LKLSAGVLRRSLAVCAKQPEVVYQS